MSSTLKNRPSKRKAVEAKVLQKAKKHVKIQEGEEEEPLDLKELSVPTINIDLKPRVKLRKPRWNKTGDDDTTSRDTTTSSVQKKKVDSSSEGSKSKARKKKGKKSKRKKDQIADPEVGRKNELEALEFLHKWNTNRDEWKFEKLKQVWLLKNALNPVVINDEDFNMLVNYVGSVMGQARRQLQQDMEKVVTDFEQNVSQRLISKPSEEETTRYQRSRQIIQMLQDDDEVD